MSYITAIGTANPGEGIPQSKIEEFMILAHDLTGKVPVAAKSPIRRFRPSGWWWLM